MFKFLKERLKGSISNISKKIEEEGKEEVVEEEVKQKEIEGLPKTEGIKEETAEERAEKKPSKKGFFSRIKEKFVKKEEPEEEGFEEVTLKSDIKEAEKEKEIKEKEEGLEEKEGEIKEKVEKKDVPSTQELAERKEQKERIIEEKLPEEEKKGIFGRIKEKIATKKINENQFDELFWSLETTLLENNVAVEVIDKIKDDLKQDLVDKPIKRSKIEETIEQTLKESIKGLFNVSEINFIEKMKEKKPFVICFVGINGSGKTTTIAKIAHFLKSEGLSCVFAASDTFRAASIEQLQKHADNLNIKLIKHDYGADPAAVAFDAIKHAGSKKIDVVLIDTAGRMHANTNLMDEMRKIVRVANPDLTIFVGEALTGNDCVEQVKTFNEAINIDGVILTKADVDEKGGAMVSVSYVTKKPILFIGTGQEYADLKKFDPEIVINSLGLEA